MHPALSLVVTIAVQAVVSLAAIAAPVMAPAVAETTGIAVTRVGLFVGIMYLAASLMSLISGDLVARFGPIRTSQIALVLCAAGLVVGAAGSPATFVLASILIGCAYGPVTPASSAILVRNTPVHRMGWTFSLKQTGVPMGGMLAGIVVPGLVPAVGWQATALVIAAICVGVAVLTETIRAPFDETRDVARAINPRASLRALKRVLAVPKIRDLGLASFVFGAMQLCLTTFLILYLTGVQDMTLARAGSILALAQLAGVVGRLGWGWTADRFVRPRPLLGVLGLISGATSLGLALAGPIMPAAVVTALAVVFGATAIGWNGVFLAEVARLAPEGEAGTVTGASLFLTYLGVVFGPPAFAMVAGADGDFGSGYLAAGAVMAAVGALLLVSRPDAKRIASLES